MLQYLSAPAERQVVGRRNFFRLSLCTVCAAGSDSSPLSTATRSAVRGLIAVAAEREEERLSTRQALSPSCANLLFWPFSFLQQFLQRASSVPRTIDPWPWFPLKPCLIQDLSASNTNAMRISKPWCGRFLAGGKRR